MKKSILFLIVFFGFASVIIAQDKSKPDSENIYTALRPADGNPVVFNSQEELNAKIEAKKKNILTLIKENSGDTAQVRILREQLWRFENAVVKPVKK